MKPSDTTYIGRERQIPTLEQRLSNFINLMVWSVRHNSDYLFERSSQRVDELTKEIEEQICT